MWKMTWLWLHRILFQLYLALQDQKNMNISPIVSAWQVWSGRVGMLWVPSIKQCHLLVPWKCDLLYSSAWPLEWSSPWDLNSCHLVSKAWLFGLAFGEDDWSPSLNFCSLLNLFSLPLKFCLVLLLCVFLFCVFKCCTVVRHPESFGIGQHINLINYFITQMGELTSEVVSGTWFTRKLGNRENLISLSPPFLCPFGMLTPMLG